MHLEPPFDQLPPPPGRVPEGPTRPVTVGLPEDIAAWLDERCGSDAVLRNNLVVLALDALRRYDEGRGWPPDVPTKPAPQFESFEAFQKWLGDAGGEDDDVSMNEVVRDIYRSRGYPMEHFKFGPDAPPDTGEAESEDGSEATGIREAA